MPKKQLSPGEGFDHSTMSASTQHSHRTLTKDRGRHAACHLTSTKYNLNHRLPPNHLTPSPPKPKREKS